MDWETSVMEPVNAMWTRVLGFLPTLVSVILILVIGFIVAAMVQKLVVRFLKLARLDTASEKAGIANILTKGDINVTLSEIIGVLIYWIIMLVVLIAAVNALNLTVAAELLNRVVLYIPSVIAGLFILVLGIFFANLLATIVRTTASNAGIRQAKALAQFTQVAIVVFAVIEAISQLQINLAFLELFFKAALGALALGIGLAIGLGCKDIAGKYIGALLDSFKNR